MDFRDKGIIFISFLIFCSFLVWLNSCNQAENKIEYSENLANIDPGIRADVIKNIPLLKDKDWKVRLSVVLTFSNMGPLAQEAVPALIEALNEPNIEVKKNVIIALGNIGHEAQTALRHLSKIQQDKNSDVLETVRNTIKLIEHDHIIDRCIKKLSKSNRSTRLQALYDLCELAPDIKKAIPIIIKTTNDRDSKIRALAIRALGIVGLFNISDFRVRNRVRIIVNTAHDDKNEYVRREADKILKNCFHNNEASKLMKSGKFDSAIVHYFKSIYFNPKDVRSYMFLRGIYMVKGNYDLEFACIDKIISFDPRNPENYLMRAAHYWRGYCIHGEEVERGKSDIDINRALYLGSRDPYLFILRCRIYSSYNKFDLALQDINRVLTIDPKNFYAYMDRAKVYYNTKNYNLAQIDLKKAIEFNIQKEQPLYSESYLYLAKILEKLGKDEEALLVYRKYNQIPLEPSVEGLFEKRLEEGMKEFKKKLESKKK